MNLSKLVSPVRRFAFHSWRSATALIPGARIGAFGGGPGQVGAILVINLDRQPRRWRRVTRELARFRTSEGLPLTSITRRLPGVDARDGRAVAATADVDAIYRIGDQLHVQPDARLTECFPEDEPVRMTRQEVAVALSHVEAWKAIATGTDDYILVLEDDVWFRPGAQLPSIGVGARRSNDPQSMVARTSSTSPTATQTEPPYVTTLAKACFGRYVVSGSSRVTCCRLTARPRYCVQCPSSDPSTSG
jgi:hypothetical protein